MSPIETTQELFLRFGNADVNGIVALLADDVRIDFYGPATIPYAGRYDGIDQGRRFFETVLSSVDIHVFEAEQFLADGPMVTVTGKLHLTAKATQKDIRSDFAHVITVKDGRWLRFRDFMDTSVAVEAFTP